MSLTYGYDLKDYNDQIITTSVEATEFVARLVLPGAILVNHLPFRASARSVIPMLQLYQCLQCGISLRGFHGLTTSHWRRKAENIVLG